MTKLVLADWIVGGYIAGIMLLAMAVVRHEIRKNRAR